MKLIAICSALFSFAAFAEIQTFSPIAECGRPGAFETAELLKVEGRQDTKVLRTWYVFRVNQVARNRTAGSPRINSTENVFESATNTQATQITLTNEEGDKEIRSIPSFTWRQDSDKYLLDLNYQNANTLSQVVLTFSPMPSQDNYKTYEVELSSGGNGLLVKDGKITGDDTKNQSFDSMSPRWESTTKIVRDGSNKVACHLLVDPMTIK